MAALATFGTGHRILSVSTSTDCILCLNENYHALHKVHAYQCLSFTIFTIHMLVATVMVHAEPNTTLQRAWYHILVCWG